MSEALGLQWADINYDHNRIHIRRAWTGGKFGATKTKASRSTVPIILEEQWNRINDKTREPAHRMPMKKWPLLDSHPGVCFGSPRIDGTRLTTEHVYQYCAGSDSDAHVTMFQEGWPYMTAKQIKQAIAFERKRRGI